MGEGYNNYTLFNAYSNNITNVITVKGRLQKSERECNVLELINILVK